MKEIKFRIWNKTKKMWCPDDHEIDFESIPHGFEIKPDKEEAVIMQYTGLYDKNKKPIYEGDVVEYEDARIGRAQVQWKECYFELLFPSGNVNFITTDKIRDMGIQVIGNIYENADLLV